MKVLFHTNLDHPKRYVHELTDVWKERFGDHVPMVGTTIEFPFERWDENLNRPTKRAFELAVVSVKYDAEHWEINGKTGCVIVELHIPKNFSYHHDDIGDAHPNSIKAWEVYFRKHVEGKLY